MRMGRGALTSDCSRSKELSMGTTEGGGERIQKNARRNRNTEKKEAINPPHGNTTTHLIRKAVKGGNRGDATINPLGTQQFISAAKRRRGIRRLRPLLSNPWKGKPLQCMSLPFLANITI